jgi:hypothetical protein
MIVMNSIFGIVIIPLGLTVISFDNCVTHAGHLRSTAVHIEGTGPQGNSSEYTNQLL